MPTAEVCDLSYLFIKEQDVFTKLQDYNTAYLAYDVSCNLSITDTATRTTNKCGTTKTSLEGKGETLQRAYNEYKNLLTNYNTNNCLNIKTNDQYDASLNALMNNYKNLSNLRSQQDMKLMELYKNTNSMSHETGLNMDSSVYVNVLWTVLATSIILLIFLKL